MQETKRQRERRTKREQRRTKKESVEVAVLSMFKECRIYNQVAEALNLSPTIVRNIVRSSSLEPSTKKEAGLRKRNAKEVFIYDDKTLGYLAGLIAADGSMRQDGFSISITLQKADISSIQAFVQLTTLNHESIPIYIYENYRYGKRCQDQATSVLPLPLLYNHLMEMNITPRKTYTLDPKLDDKSDEFLWYFLRGVIDGDGHIKVRKLLGSSQIQITSASRLFMNTLQRVYGGTVGGGTEHRSCYDLVFSGKYAKVIAEKLPKEELFMPRKTKKLNDLIALTSKTKTQPRVSGSIWSTPSSRSI